MHHDIIIGVRLLYLCMKKPRFLPRLSSQITLLGCLLFLKLATVKESVFASLFKQLLVCAAFRDAFF